MPTNADRPALDAGWKLGWIETIADDPGLTLLTKVVAIKISQRIDRDGIARTASQAWIAKRIGASERAVRRCMIQLCKAGYLERMKPGSRSPSGRSRAAELRPVKKATDLRPAPLMGNNSIRTPESTQTESTRTLRSEIPDSTVQNTGLQSPPFPSPFQQYFQARERARGGNPAHVQHLGGPWRPMKEYLARSSDFGSDKVTAWLDKLSMHSIIDRRMTLLAPTAFLANYVNREFADHLLRAWRAVDPEALGVGVRAEYAPRSTLADDARKNAGGMVSGGGRG